MSKHQSCLVCGRDFVGPDLNIGENPCPDCQCDNCAKLETERDMLENLVAEKDQEIQELQQALEAESG